MNYCPRCGAYIPEGYEECLACGYSIREQKRPDTGTADASHRPSGTGATATAQAPDPAEYHQSHRKTEKQNTEQYEYGTETDEKTKRKFDRATEELRDASDYQSVSYLSYLGPLFLIPLLFCKQSRFAQYHARQGLKLCLLEVLVNICWSMGFLGVLAAIAGTFLSVWCALNGLLNVNQKKKRPLPVIGNLFSEYNGG